LGRPIYKSNMDPTGTQNPTGSGFTFHPWVRVPVWFLTRVTFIMGRVFAPPNPNPTHCHPYYRSHLTKSARSPLAYPYKSYDSSWKSYAILVNGLWITCISILLCSMAKATISRNTSLRWEVPCAFAWHDLSIMWYITSHNFTFYDTYRFEIILAVSLHIYLEKKRQIFTQEFQIKIFDKSLNIQINPKTSDEL
jgi:hypothetical protein